MRKLLLLAGAACMAASIPAAADPGDRGKGKGRAHAAKLDRGENRAERRAHRAEQRAVQQRRGANQRRAVQQRRVAQQRRAAAQERRAVQRRAVERRQAARERVRDRRERLADVSEDRREQIRERRQRIRERRADAIQQRRERLAEIRQDRRERLAELRQDRRERLARQQRIERQQRLRARRAALREQQQWRQWQRAAYFDDRGYRYGHRDACPPGLIERGTYCLPPGQARRLFARGDRVQPALFDDYQLPARYRSFYRDTPHHYYRYDDEGYIYRIGRQQNLVSSVIPLFGGGFAVGQPLPAGYDVYNVPYAYRDIYYDTDDRYYRYGDEAIYRVDPQSNMIESIVSLLAGDLAVGQPLPAGYDVYNVPLDYRDRYYDTDEHMYRYADNAIYQVDPETMLVQAIVEMLV